MGSTCSIWKAVDLGFDDPKYIVRTWQDRLDAVEAGWCLDVGEASATTAFARHGER